MNTLVNDEETVEKSATVVPADLDDILSDYRQAATIESDEEGNDIQENGSNSDDIWTEEDRNNPALFYQSGKKAGQPRPKAIEIKRNNYQAPNASIKGDIISGMMFITLVDTIFPLLLGFINSRFDSKKINANDLKLSAKQKKELEPLCDEVMKAWNIEANPAVLLTISLVGIYGMNYVMLRENG